MDIVLQKYIANSGHCSRRQAEELIKQKKVKINGELAYPGARVNIDDEVTIGTKNIKNSTEKLYFMLNKPAGYTCTNKSFKGEKNIFELIKIQERLFVIGRLDKESRGLILLTNDGELAQKLTHPSFKHEKEYIVTIEKPKDRHPEDIVRRFRSGVNLEDNVKVKVRNVHYQNHNKFKIILTEGRKRQIRMMFRVLGVKVKDLQRVRIDKIQMGNLKEGTFKKLKKI